MKIDSSKRDSKYKTIGEVAKILNLINQKNGTFSTHTIRFKIFATSPMVLYLLCSLELSIFINIFFKFFRWFK